MAPEAEAARLERRFRCALGRFGVMLDIGLGPTIRAPRNAAWTRVSVSRSSYSSWICFPMSADPKSRARVVRLLRGEFRPDDLASLFLFARDHCDGRETVAEIGHFVAHHSERNKGITTRSTRDWFSVARYHMWYFRPEAGGEHITDLGRLPPAAPDYFKIAVPRIPAKFLKERTGLRAAKAHEMLCDLAPQLTQVDGGCWRVPNVITQSLAELISCVSSMITVRPAFEPSRLTEEFFATLKSNALITNDEVHKHRDAIDPLLQLFAVSIMHNCVVQIKTGQTTQLQARAGPMEKEIKVDALVPVDDGPFLAASMFTAKLDPAVHCQPELLTSPQWDFEIELTPDRLLARLQ